MKKIISFLHRHMFASYVAALALVFSFFAFGPFIGTVIVKAMPDTFCDTGIATSSPVYLTPGGTATTTLYATAGCASEMYGTKVYSMLANFIASSSVTTYQIKQEFATRNSVGTNCISVPSACEWYESTYTSLPAFSTSSAVSIPLDIADVPVYQYKFASSTVGGVAVTTGLNGPNATNNRTTKLIQFPALTAYSRWIITVKSIANGNGAFAGEIVGKKEIGEK